MNAHLFMIGVEKTQGIALDEIINPPRDKNGVVRDTLTFRKTRVTNLSKPDQEDRESIRSSINSKPLLTKTNEDEEIKIPAKLSTSVC